MVNIIVIGAGVVGLSTAVNIQRVLPEVKVKVVADRFYDETTSIGAGGLFIPTTAKVPGTPADTIKRWCETSWNAYSKLATSELASTTGQAVSHGYLFYKTKAEKPLFADMVFSFREMLPEELTRLGVSISYRFGHEVTTIVTNMRKYLTWLMKEFTDHGGRVEKRKIDSLTELYGQCDIVVNCSGLCSQQLCGDKLIYPLRGQCIRVDAPWVKDWAITDDVTYIIPSDDFTLLGGTKELDNVSLTPDQTTKDRIMDSCLELWPALTGARVIGDWVGLRPMRTPLRLEQENMAVQDGILKVVHNYGHGSVGVVLSWGTAVEAAEMVKELITSTKI